MRLIFCIRPFSFIFRRNWYSLYRLRHDGIWGVEGIDDERLYLIDLGMITFGFAKKVNKW